MKRHFVLPHGTIKDLSLDFFWDDDTGEITGKSATEVIEAAKIAKESGLFYPPGGTGYVIVDPFKNIGELAVILDPYVLTDDLKYAASKVEKIPDDEFFQPVDLDGNPVDLLMVN
jgi:hypothetical protein